MSKFFLFLVLLAILYFIYKYFKFMAVLKSTHNNSQNKTVVKSSKDINVEWEAETIDFEEIKEKEDTHEK